MPRSTLWFVSMLCVIGLLRPAHAIVAPYGSMPKPKGVHVAKFGAGSAVPIGRDLLLTAAHVRGGAGTRVILAGETFFATEVINHPKKDLAVVRVDRGMPFWNEIASGARKKQRVVIGGFGALPIKDGRTFWWSNLREEKWGENSIKSTRRDLIKIRLDHRENRRLEHESLVSRGDSGGGFFVNDAGSLKLIGVTIGTRGPRNGTRFGSTATALDVTEHLDFIFDAAAAAGFEGEIAGEDVQPVPTPGAAALLAPAAWLTAGRRRR